jgi:hypothetical protein
VEPYTPCLLSKAVGLLRDATFVAPRARPCSARSASCRAGHSTGVCPRRAWEMKDLPGRQAFEGVAESVHRRLISTFSVSRPVPPHGVMSPEPARDVVFEGGMERYEGKGEDWKRDASPALQIPCRDPGRDPVVSVPSRRRALSIGAANPLDPRRSASRTSPPDPCVSPPDHGQREGGTESSFRSIARRCHGHQPGN